MWPFKKHIGVVKVQAGCKSIVIKLVMLGLRGCTRFSDFNIAHQRFYISSV